MAEEFYFDTAIWMDFHEKRGKNGENALKLIEKVILNDLKIVHSERNIDELKSIGYSPDEVNAILDIVKPNYTRKILVGKAQMQEAKKLSRERNVSQSDALHAILARDNDLQMIALDHDFDHLKDIARAKPPEDFIED